jgi:hypothetical protein
MFSKTRLLQILNIILWYNKVNILTMVVQVETTIYAIVGTKMVLQDI